MASLQSNYQLGLLPERKIDRRALAASYGFVVMATLFLINLGLLFPDRIALKEYRVTELIPMPAMKPEPAPVKVKRVKVKLLPPAPVFERPKLVVPHEVHRMAPEPIEPPKVIVNQFAAPQIKMASAARPQLVHTGDFGGSSVTPTVNMAVEKVQTGGFGDPNGIPAKAGQTKAVNIAAAGSFDLPSGPGYGNGTGGAKGAPGVVVSTGFGNGTAVPDTRPRSTGTVQASGFASADVPAPPTVHSRPAETAAKVLPAEILSKPTPVYTQEARNLRIEGEVLLEVVLEASGKLRVVRVVHGLGHGLDDNAVKAAEQIHFKPAVKDGQPTDSTVVVHIIFQIA